MAQKLWATILPLKLALTSCYSRVSLVRSLCWNLRNYICSFKHIVMMTGSCLSSGCTDDIFTSDHSPVFATFQVGVTSQLISKTGAVIFVPLWTQTHKCSRIPWLCDRRYPAFQTDPNSSIERAWIELEGVEAIVKTASKAKFFIEFHSSCLEGTVSDQKQTSVFSKVSWSAVTNTLNLFAETRRSSENDSQSCEVPRFLKLGWSSKHLPKVRGSGYHKWMKSI